jgi:hypothetical protein
MEGAVLMQYDRNPPKEYDRPLHVRSYQGRPVQQPFPTLKDWYAEHVARNDPDPREDLVHPFVD